MSTSIDEETRTVVMPEGGAYQARFALRSTVEDQHITRHHVYEDSLAVSRAFDR